MGQFTSILARQAAFEARVDTGMARLSHNLAEVASTMNMRSPRSRNFSAGNSTTGSIEFAMSSPRSFDKVPSMHPSTPRNWQPPPAYSFPQQGGGSRHNGMS